MVVSATLRPSAGLRRGQRLDRSQAPSDVGEIMPIYESGRRGFLKRAGLVVPGLALVNEIPTSAAEGAAEVGHPDQSRDQNLDRRNATGFYDVGGARLRSG